MRGFILPNGWVSEVKQPGNRQANMIQWMIQGTEAVWIGMPSNDNMRRLEVHMAANHALTLTAHKSGWNRWPAESPVDDRPTPTREGLLQFLLDKFPGATAESKLRELGIDSLEVTDLLVEISNAYKVNTAQFQVRADASLDQLATAFSGG
jgi:hypothetical protein